MNVEVGDYTSSVSVSLPIKYSSDSQSIFSGKQNRKGQHGGGFIDHEQDRLNVVRGAREKWSRCIGTM